MTGWQWLWTLIGYLIFIIILIFLYFYEPLAVLFDRVVSGISFSNIIFWVSVIVGIVGLCIYHWHAYRIHMVRQNSAEAMVLAALRGSTFIAVLLSGGAMLQALQIVCVRLLNNDYVLDREFGERLAAVVALVILTGAFYIIYWLLRFIRHERQHEGGPAGL